MHDNRIPCYICGALFTPDPARLRVWAESGSPWEPTDWQCPACERDMAAQPWDEPPYPDATASPIP